MRKLLIIFALTSFCRITALAQSSEIQHLQKILPGISDSIQYVNALNRIAMLLYEKNIDSTFYYARIAREISTRLEYKKGEADAINNLGIFYDLKGNVQLALQYYNEAYNRYKAIRDTENEVQGLMNIAGVYNEMGKDDRAIRNFKKALNRGRKLKRDSIMGLVIYDYLLEYPHSVRPDSVDYYIARARTIGIKYNDQRLLLVLDQLIADNYIRNNKRDEGLALLKQTIDKALDNNLYYLSLDIIIDMGGEEIKTDTSQGLGYYKEALSIADNKGYLIYSQMLARKLYDFYAAEKDYATAYYYSNQLLKFRDQQDRLNLKSGIDYIDYAVKEQQLAASRTRSEYATVFLVLAIMICIVMFVAAMILWRNWKKTIETEKALRLQFEQAEKTTEALDTMNKNYARLIKIVAHDLRNPLGAVGTMASLIAEKKPGDEVEELTGLIQTSVDNSLRLINELLKPDLDSQQNLHREPIVVDELLQQCVSLLNFRAKDKGQELIFKAGARVEIMADREKLWRVMNNLIVNAIKFSPGGSRIFVASGKQGKMICISVTDAGIGIAKEVQEKIFDPFTSARRNGTDGEQPFGLGLYISKQIVEAHGGKIRVKSEPGHGTEFIVELPLTGPTFS